MITMKEQKSVGGFLSELADSLHVYFKSNDCDCVVFCDDAFCHCEKISEFRKLDRRHIIVRKAAFVKGLKLRQWDELGKLWLIYNGIMKG